METKERKRTGSTGTVQRVKTPPKRTRRAPARESVAKKPAPEVVYTQPGPFNRNRFLLHLATVVAVVLALIFGMSIFFKVDIEKITVSGHNKYRVQEIIDASGIRDGENLLTLSDAKISPLIIDRLPYINSVRVGIKLPDTVILEVQELDVVYTAEAEDGSWWLMTADGRIVDRTNEAETGNYTKIIGIRLTAPAIGETAVAAEPHPSQSQEEGEETIAAFSGKEQMETAISLLQFLEKQSVLGLMTTIDVTDLTALEMWYGQRYQVTLGDTMQLDYKVACMKKAIDQLGQHDRGVLDVSFTTWPEEVGFTPFSD